MRVNGDDLFRAFRAYVRLQAERYRDEWTWDTGKNESVMRELESRYEELDRSGQVSFLFQDQILVSWHGGQSLFDGKSAQNLIDLHEAGELNYGDNA